MRIAGRGSLIGDAESIFTFDGKRMAARQGDTVASALLANGVKLVGRSFKYHRPRGILTAGPEEPNALIQVGAGDAMTPNVRATVQEVFDGLVTTSQNHVGPLHRDLMSVNDVLWPFLGAGFYHKTFMWPRGFWERLYEPAIRRAAGLGTMTPAGTQERSERAFAFCDVLVIGAGPAGLMAALTAAESGADVILADEGPELGGRLQSDTDEIDGMAGPAFHAHVRTRLEATGRVRIMPRTTVTGVHDGLAFGALERVGHHLPATRDLPKDCFWRIRAKQAVLAAGAMERAIAFPANDRPGIMLASAIRGYLGRYGVAAGRSVALFTSHDEAHRTAIDLIGAGVHVAAVIDSRTGVERRGDYRLIEGGRVVATRGRRALTGITVETGGGSERIAADCLGMSGGWNPTLHLTCHLGARPVWDAERHMFLPAPDAVPGLHPAGACAGRMSTAGCLEDGIAAAARAVAALGLTVRRPPVPKARAEAGGGQALWHVPGKGRAWLDFANDVTTGDVALAAREGFRSVEHMKRYTTLGMAPDQGKTSAIGALAILADATGRGIPETGTTTYRPPFAPVPMNALGAGAEGAGFAPERKTTSHAALVARGAPMIAAGLWYRASHVPAPDETHWRESRDREVGYVRNAVGVTDVSTLGKIEIFGPDAGAFLDFVYTNVFSTLKVGRARYGLMLREDGFVMDDGATARLGERHYVTTTTTAAAEQVAMHLDFVLQCLRPGMKVRLVSVTDQWAQFSVAGPRARTLLNGILDTPVRDETFPFMACGGVRLHGIDGRLFRISFSGEHAYEVAVPARFGDALHRDLVARAEALGGGAYGLEALDVLRLEKGFVTHSEIHGRATAFDLGMQPMLSRKKDFIGRVAATRPGLLEDARERLVGLRPVAKDGVLTAGAHLFAEGAAATRVDAQGHVTSAGHSPTLGHPIALGFLKGGPDRIGEVIAMVDHLRDIRTSCRVCDPVFFDPGGGRARG